MKTKGEDFFPDKEKTKITREIFKILGLNEEISDFSEHTVSGGGGTVTKHAWGKILKRLQELKQKGLI